jgi:hypothetical protein
MVFRKVSEHEMCFNAMNSVHFCSVIFTSN